MQQRGSRVHTKSTKLEAQISVSVLISSHVLCALLLLRKFLKKSHVKMSKSLPVHKTPEMQLSV